jgi:ligand-binding sensor protein
MIAEELRESSGATSIRDVIGEETLARAQDTYLNPLGGSAATFEIDGTQAYVELRSEYCSLIRRASRQLAHSSGRENPAPGSWCAECCEAARDAMATGKPAFAECPAGLTLYAVPIVACGTLVGALGAALGSPPQDDVRLRVVAEKFRLPVPLVRAVAESYSPRPARVIDGAKRQMEGVAALLGSLYAARSESLSADRQGVTRGGSEPRRLRSGQCAGGTAPSRSRLGCSDFPHLGDEAWRLVEAASQEPVWELQLGALPGMSITSWARQMPGVSSLGAGHGPPIARA